MLSIPATVEVWDRMTAASQAVNQDMLENVWIPFDYPLGQDPNSSKDLQLGI